MKRNKAFTLIEILIVVVVLGVVATTAIASYQRIVEQSKAKVCQQNIKMLTTAVKLYSLENDSLPAALSQIPQTYYRKAYAQVIEKGPMLTKLARKVVDHDHSSLAFAINFEHDNFKQYGTNEENWVCPTQPGATQSYAINDNLEGLRWSFIMKHYPDTPIVGEKNSGRTFTSTSELSTNHKLSGQDVAFIGTASGETMKAEDLSTSGVTPISYGDDQTEINNWHADRGQNKTHSNYHTARVAR